MVSPWFSMPCRWFIASITKYRAQCNCTLNGNGHAAAIPTFALGTAMAMWCGSEDQCEMSMCVILGLIPIGFGLP